MDIDWKNLKSVVLFGYGRRGKKIVTLLKKDFNIVAIIDNDAKKKGMTEDGINILTFDEGIEYLKNNKVIVSLQQYYYLQIKSLLNSIGLQENKDYVHEKTFISEWYSQFKHLICVPKTDMFITSVCSLNCEKCMTFVPFFKNKKDQDIEVLKKDIDTYFSCVDFVSDFDLLGGEPFLYKELQELIQYIGDKYRKKIGYFGIITNGTIIPNNTIIKCFKKYDMSVSISDYSSTINYKDKVDLLCSILKSNNIEYVRNTNIQWFDFGFPQNPYFYDEKNIKAHMQCCNTSCQMICDGKLYYCAMVAMAEKSGLFETDNQGVVELSEIDINNFEDRKNIIDCCNGKTDRGYLKLCKLCGGFGIDNNNEVETAKQMLKF